MERPVLLNWKCALPLLVLGVVAFTLSFIEMPYGDAIGYTFLVSSDPDVISNQPITNLTDLLTSQCNHYLAVNGRFVVHILVQIFCSFLPAAVFSLCNAAVYIAFIFASFRLVGKKVSESSPATIWSASALFLIMIRPDDFHPPMMINYIWTGFLIIVTIRLFLFSSSRKPVSLILLALLSLIAGECNETFSIPVAMMMLGYACVRKFRLSPAQWVMGPAFAIGTLILCLAPGNFVRMEDVNAHENPLQNQMEYLIISLIPLAIYFIIRIFSRQETRQKSFYSLISLVILSLLTCLVFKFSSGVRMSTPAAMALFALCIPTLGKIRVPGLSALFLTVIASCVVFSQIKSLSSIRQKYEHAVYSDYPSSTDGRVFIADSLFSFKFRHLNYHSIFFSRQRQAVNPQAPDLHLLPDALRKIPRDSDINRLVKISDNSWLLIQSKKHPSDFILYKKLGFGKLSKSLSPKILNLSPQGDLLIDSTAFWRAGWYVNDRPYIIPEISLSNEDSLSR